MQKQKTKIKSSMTRSNKFLYNTLTSAFQQGIFMILGFITPRVMLVAYGSEVNGLVTSIRQFISYFILVEAGLSGATVFALYKPLANNDYDEINGVVSAAKKFYFSTGYFFSALLIGMAFLYPWLIKTTSLSKWEVGILVILLGGNGLVDFFGLAKYRTIITADQKVYVLAISNTICNVLNALVIICFASNSFSVIWLQAIATSTIFIRSAILYIYTKKHYSYLDCSVKPNYKSLDKRWDALFLQILGVVQRGSPTVLLTVFSTLKTVSIYSIYNMVLSGIASVLDIFLSGLSSSFGDIIARKEEKTLQKAYRDFEFTYYALITVVYSTAFVTILKFVELYTNGVNDANYVSPILGGLFVINGLLYNIKTPQGMLVIAAGLYKETKVQSTIQALIIIVLGIILTPIYGLIGILIALCASNLYRDIDLVFYIPKTVTKLKPTETIYRIFYFSIGFILVLISTSFIEVSINSYYQWTVYAVGVFLISFLCIVLCSFIFDRKQLYAVIKRTLSILGQKVKK